MFAPSVGHLHSLADDRGALGRCTGWSGSTTPAIATYTSPLLHCTRPTEVAPPPEGGFRLADNGLVKGVGTWHGRSPPGCTRPVSPRVGSRALGRSPRELFEGEWGPSVDVTLMVPTNLVMATRGWFERVRGAAHICRVPPTARRSPTTVPLAIRRLPQPASRAGWPAAVIVFCAPLGWARRSEWSLIPQAFTGLHRTRRGWGALVSRSPCLGSQSDPAGSGGSSAAALGSLCAPLAVLTPRLGPATQTPTGPQAS